MARFWGYHFTVSPNMCPNRRCIERAPDWSFDKAALFISGWCPLRAPPSDWIFTFHAVYGFI